MKRMYQCGYVPVKVPKPACAHAGDRANFDQQMRSDACRKSKQLSLQCPVRGDDLASVGIEGRGHGLQPLIGPVLPVAVVMGVVGPT